MKKTKLKGILTLLISVFIIIWNIFDIAVHISLNMVEPLRITGNIIGIIATLFVIVGLFKKQQHLILTITVIGVIIVNAAHPILWGAELTVAIFIGTSLFLLIILTQLMRTEVNVKDYGKDKPIHLRWWLSVPVTVIGLVIIFGVGYFVDQPRYEYMSGEQTDSTKDSDVPKAVGNGAAEILSAFYGLDAALPREVNNWIRGANGLDGMPVVFSTEIDLDTMQAGDFKVTFESGKVGYIHGVTLVPAIGEGEKRTMLVVGELGSVEDPPELFEVIGNLYSIDKRINYKGSIIEVIPLEEGAEMVYAEIVPKAYWYPGREIDRIRNSGSGTPVDGVDQVVRVIWSGGVKLANHEQPGEAELTLFDVVVEAEDGSTRVVHPVAFADLGDGDNNLMLCLTTDDKVLSVSFPEGIFVDPNEDLNPKTSIEVTYQ